MSKEMMEYPSPSQHVAGDALRILQEGIKDAEADMAFDADAGNRSDVSQYGVSLPYETAREIASLLRHQTTREQVVGYIHRLKGTEDWNISLASQMESAFAYQEIWPDKIEIVPLYDHAAPASPAVGTVACHCTMIEQDESCPVGYPSLLCEECDGKGHIFLRPPTDAIKRLRAYASGSNDAKFDTYDAADVLGYLNPPPEPNWTGLKEDVEAAFRRHMDAAPYAKDLFKRLAFEVVPMITHASAPPPQSRRMGIPTSTQEQEGSE